MAGPIYCGMGKNFGLIIAGIGALGIVTDKKNMIWSVIALGIGGLTYLTCP
jgi:hypothetical protein